MRSYKYVIQKVFIPLIILIFFLYKTAFIAHNTTNNGEFY
jgi:hypothetical protein